MWAFQSLENRATFSTLPGVRDSSLRGEVPPSSYLYLKEGGKEEYCSFVAVE